MKRVKNISKMVMLLAMFTTIFTFNACSENNGDGDGSSSSNGGGNNINISSSSGGGTTTSSSSGNAGIPDAIPLIQGVPSEGTITSPDGEVWYSFNVTQGNAYLVSLNDRDNSDYTLDAMYAAYYSNETEIFDTDNEGEFFIAASTGKVYVKVYPYPNSSKEIGTFSIAYDAISITPLTEGVLKSGSITNSDDEAFYSFSVIQGNTYIVSLNDSDNSDYTLDAGLGIFYGNGNVIFDDDANSYQFTATSNGTVYVVVYSAYGGTGTFAVAYEKWTAPNDAISLTPDEFIDGEITDIGGEVWYSFNVTQGTEYYVILYDNDNDEDYTLDAMYAAYYNNGDEIFDTDNYSYQLFEAKSSGKVYVKVYPYPNSSKEIGTFSIVYGETEEMPLGKPASAPPTTKKDLKSKDTLKSKGFLKSKISSKSKGSLKK